MAEPHQQELPVVNGERSGLRVCITSLGLAVCKIGSRGCLALASNELPESLTSLDLSMNAFGTRGGLGVLAVVPKLKQLQRLSVARNGIGGEEGLTMMQVRRLGDGSRVQSSPLVKSFLFVTSRAQR